MKLFFAEISCGLQKTQVTRVVRLREKRSTGAQFQRCTFLSPANKIGHVPAAVEQFFSEFPARTWQTDSTFVGDRNAPKLWLPNETQ